MSFRVMLTRLLGVSLSMTSNHLYKHGSRKMGIALRKAIYAKMLEQDMSHFEQTFKRKDQARVMINVYLSQKIMMRVDRVLYRIQDLSRIVTAFAMLWRKNLRLLLVMQGESELIPRARAPDTST
jgi:hypothetical protein